MTQPSKDEEFTSRWRALDRGARRQIARKAGQGRTLSDPDKASLVAGFARQRLALWWEPWVGAVLVFAGFIAISLALWERIPWVAGVAAVVAYLAVILWQRRRMSAALEASEALLSGRGGETTGNESGTE